MKLNGLDKTSLASAFLLLLFAGGLGLAMLLVNSRATVALSEPIPLPGEGLSVVLPVGAGWKTLREWTYEQDNSFALVAVYSLPGALPIEVRWQYRLAEPHLSPEALLNETAKRFSGITSSLKKFDGPLPFFQIHLFSRTNGEQLLLSAAVPQKGRALMLQLKSYSEPLYLSDLFEQLAGRVQFQPDPRRQFGSRLFDEVSRRFYPQWLEKLTHRPEVFVLTSPVGQVLGYSKTALSKSDSGNSAVVELEQLFRQIDSPRLLSRFESADNLSEFTWTTARQIRRRPLQTLLRRQPDGSLQIEDSYQRPELIWPAKNAVPEFLLPLTARALLRCEQPQAVLDLIAFSGQVVPILLSRSEASATAGRPEQTQFVVKIEFLHHSENYEEYYYDGEQNLLGRLEVLPGQPSRLWKAADEADFQRFLNPSSRKPDQIVQKGPLSNVFAFGQY